MLIEQGQLKSQLKKKSVIVWGKYCQVLSVKFHCNPSVEGYLMAGCCNKPVLHFMLFVHLYKHCVRFGLMAMKNS